MDSRSCIDIISHACATLLVNYASETYTTTMKIIYDPNHMVLEHRTIFSRSESKKKKKMGRERKEQPS